MKARWKLCTLACLCVTSLTLNAQESSDNDDRDTADSGGNDFIDRMNEGMEIHGQDGGMEGRP